MHTRSARKRVQLSVISNKVLKPADTTLMIEGVPIVSTISSSDMTEKILQKFTEHQIVFVLAFIMSADPFHSLWIIICFFRFWFLIWIMYRLILGKWNRQLWVELHNRPREWMDWWRGLGWAWSQFNHCVTSRRGKNAQQGRFSGKTRRSSPKANEIVVYLHGKVLVMLIVKRRSKEISISPSTSLVLDPCLVTLLFGEEFKSIIHKQGQKAWGTLRQPSSCVPIQHHPPFSSLEDITDDLTELDGSSEKDVNAHLFSFFPIFCESSRFVPSFPVLKTLLNQNTDTPTTSSVMEFFPALLLCAVGFQSLRQFSFFSRWRRRARKIKSINENRFWRRGDPGLSEMGKQSLRFRNTAGMLSPLLNSLVRIIFCASLHLTRSKTFEITK